MLKGNLTRLQLIPLMPLPPTVTPSPKVPKPRPEIGDMFKKPDLSNAPGQKTPEMLELRLFPPLCQSVFLY